MSVLQLVHLLILLYTEVVDIKRRHKKCPFLIERGWGDLEHLIYFQKLIAKLNSKYTVNSINQFIKENYSDILEKQYASDKQAGKISNRKEFLEKYFESEGFFIDERTYRRWRKKNLKNGLQSKYFDIFRKMPATEKLFNEYYLKNFSNSVMNQSDQMFLKTCYELRGTRLLRIIGFILPILKTKDDLPIEEYIIEFKKALWEYEAYQEYLDEHEFDDLPRYSFNRKSSSISIPYRIIRGRTVKKYILENKKQPNIMAEILEQNHFQKALENEN
ncbi:hypothetical protein [Streptococcus suis]|uniref:hypothetical protein n=1 Tax=Streptococcus suis TaxID=1307 RepID=UPI001ABC6DA6|nr:hypothetical protein [Streptococcus suis]MBO3642805.1 hypothetical protein [Streptococcus suis]